MNILLKNIFCLTNLFLSNIYFMKKIFILGFVFCLLFACSLHGGFLSRLAEFDASARVCFYCSEVQNLENASTQKNGDGAIISCAAENAIDVYKSITNCFGYSIRFNDVALVEEILSQIRVLKTQVSQGITSYFGLAPATMFFDFLGGYKINVQVAVCKDYIVVGSPIILGSY